MSIFKYLVGLGGGALLGAYAVGEERRNEGAVAGGVLGLALGYLASAQQAGTPGPGGAIFTGVCEEYGGRGYEYYFIGVDAASVEWEMTTNQLWGTLPPPISITDVHPSDEMKYSAAGCTFTSDIDCELTEVIFKLRKVGAPTGTAHVSIYLANGNLPVGSPLAMSSGVEVSSLITDWGGDGTVRGKRSFLFDPHILIDKGQTYCVLYENPTTGFIDDGNYVDVQRPSSGPPTPPDEFWKAQIMLENGVWSFLPTPTWPTVWLCVKSAEGIPMPFTTINKIVVSSTRSEWDSAIDVTVRNLTKATSYTVTLKDHPEANSSVIVDEHADLHFDKGDQLAVSLFSPGWCYTHNIHVLLYSAEGLSRSKFQTVPVPQPSQAAISHPRYGALIASPQSKQRFGRRIDRSMVRPRFRNRRIVASNALKTGRQSPYARHQTRMTGIMVGKRLVVPGRRFR